MYVFFLSIVFCINLISCLITAKENTLLPHRQTLLAARKIYSQCASKIEADIACNRLNDLRSRQIIGTGVANEWLRRSAEMDSVVYMGKSLNKSKRNESFIEVLRFSFSWFAINAIYTRAELRDIIGTPFGNGEYAQFLVLYNNATLPYAADRLRELHDLLDVQTSPRLPHAPSGKPVTTLAAISLKYLPDTAKGAPAKAIERAVNSGNSRTLDIPTLIYSFRNWSVHGNTLDGCFGSRPGFLRYVTLLEELLAEVHLCTAQTLLKHL